MSRRGVAAVWIGVLGSLLTLGLFTSLSSQPQAQGMAVPAGSGTSSGTNTGDVSIGAFGSAPDAKGASISGQVITMQPGDATRPGLLSIVAQTFKGLKTFADGLTSTGVLTVNNDAVITSNVSAVNFQSGNTDPAQIRGIQSDASGSIAVKISNATTLTTAGATIAEFSPDNYVTRKSRVDLNGFYLQPVQTVTIPNDGAGTAPASTITPTSNQIALAYNDATNASVGTISETGAQAGTIVYITHTGTGGTVVFTEVAGQQEIGATACTLGLSDTLSAIYVNSSWHFLTCRDN